MNLDKSYKCHFCKKFQQDLSSLPFNRFICNDCIEYKCLNEYKSEDDTKDDLDNINAVGLYMDRIDKHYKKVQMINAQDANNIGVKLFKIKNRVQEFKENILNYENRIKSNIDFLRYEIDINFQTIKSQLETKRLNLISRVNLHENEALDSLKINQQDLKVSIDKFVEKNAFWTNYLNTETMKLKENFDYEIYKKSIETQMSNFLIDLNSQKFISFKHLVQPKSGNNMKFGLLESKSNSQEKNTSQTIFNQNKRPNSSGFSMDNILNIKKQSEKSIKSIFVLENLDQDNYLIYTTQDQDSQFILLNKQGEISNTLILNDEIYAVNSNGKNVFICHKDSELMDEYDSQIKVSNYDADLRLLDSKSIIYIDFIDNIPLDIYINDKKIYLLTANMNSKHLGLYVFNINLDLLNSFDLNENAYLSEETKSYFKVNETGGKVYIKQKNMFGTRLDIIDAIYGKLIKRLNLSYNFDFFYILNESEQKDNKEVSTEFSIKISPSSSTEDINSSSNEKLVFFADKKYFLYDLNDDCVLFKNYFYRSKSNSKIVSNIFCLDRNLQVISLILN